MEEVARRTFGPPPWFAWLVDEMRPTPSRWPMTLRMVLVVTLVLIISMTLQVPNVALSAYMVLFVTKQNRAITFKLGFLLVLGVTIAIAASLALLHLTLDHPPVRFFTMAALVCLAMYLSRVFAIGPLGFGIAFVIAIAQTIPDGISDPDQVVRALLWLWVSTAYPIVLTVAINQFVVPDHPETAVCRAIDQRLGMAADLLRAAAEGRRPASVSGAAATQGNASLVALLELSDQPKGELANLVEQSERILVAATALNLGSGIETADRTVCRELHSELISLQETLRIRRPLSAFTIFPTDRIELLEIQQAIAAARYPAARRPSPPSPKMLFAADWRSNPAYFRFALKVTLAAMACYVIYSAVDWPGIRTAFITCCIVALESAGATLRKALQRLTGCVLGGALGFLTVLYLIPQMETIVSLAALTAAVTLLVGWLAGGSERIAYAGLQMGLAFYLTVFHGFAPDTDLTAARDRFVGITLGIVVMSVVFQTFWPETAKQALRAALGRIRQGLAELLRYPSPDGSVPDLAGLRNRLAKNHREAAQALELSAFELAEKNQESEREKHASLQQATIFGSLLVSDSGIASWRKLSPAGRQRDDSLRQAIAGILLSSPNASASEDISLSENPRSLILASLEATVRDRRYSGNL